MLARRRMSAAELARRTGIKTSTMSRRMTGETAFDLDDLEVIAAALGITVADLMHGATSANGSQTTGPRLRQTVRPSGHRPKIGGQNAAPPPHLRRPTYLESAAA